MPDHIRAMRALGKALQQEAAQISDNATAEIFTRLGNAHVLASMQLDAEERERIQAMRGREPDGEAR